MNVLFLLIVFLLAAVLTGRGKVRCPQLRVEYSAQIKGLAALLILLGHCIGARGEGLYAYMNTGWYCVAIFFFWSGYGISAGFSPQKSAAGVLAKRMTKLFVPFLLANVIYLVVKSVFGVSFTWESVGLSFLGKGTIVTNSWYVIAVAVFYLAFEFAYRIAPDRRLANWGICLIVVLITGAEALIVGKQEDWWYISNLAFVFGILLAEKKELLARWKWIAAAAGAVYFAGLVIMPVLNRTIGYSHAGYILSCNLMSAGVAAAVVVLCDALSLSSKLLRWLGERSYEIYLYHGLFIFLTRTVMKITNQLALILLVGVGTVLFSACIYRIDRILLSRIGAKKQPS